MPEMASVEVGLLHVLIKHTSASLTLNENASPDVRRDFETWFSRAVPEGADYWTHTLEGDDDMPAHIKASLLGPDAHAAGARRRAGARHLAGDLPLRAPRRGGPADAGRDPLGRVDVRPTRVRTYVRMRWDDQRVDAEEGRELPGYRDPAVVRTFDAPEALDTRFYEVRAKSALNRVPEQSRMPFRWTVNPYRGCTHACNYCFARPTHTYLDLDAGRDFEKEIVVKVNVPEVLRAELSRPRWTHEHVALGTNTDPYQWVEGRYKLMPGIWEAFRDTGTPASVLTKSPLLLRDLELMRQVPDISAALSVPTLEEKAWRATEPHTPHPRARLEAVGRAQPRRHPHQRADRAAACPASTTRRSRSSASSSWRPRRAR